MATAGPGNSRRSAFRAGWNDDGNPRQDGDDPALGSWRDRLCNEREDPKWDSFSWLTVRALFESVNDLLAKFRPEIIDERRARWVAEQRRRGVVDSAEAGANGDEERAEGFSWPNIRAIVESVNDLLAELVPQGADRPPVPWSAEPSDPRSARRRDAARLTIDRRKPGPRAFFLIGDTGEQDASQYAVTPYLHGGMTKREPSTYNDPDGESMPPEFMVIVSDVIYPAGDINEYVNGFYVPYRGFNAPIYAIPGNHDWYDGLNGFMYHFCGAEPLPPERFRTTEVAPSTRLASLLWRGSETPQRNTLSRWRDKRPWGRDDGKAVQPAPYFAVDLGDLMLVAIDTGVTGTIDDEQGRWLLRVSEIPKQKILLTGKPIYVDDAYHPGPIDWKRRRLAKGEEDPGFETVDDIVRESRFGYIAAIGGDVHNYQRYPIRLTEQERTLYYLVSGGGGAYLSPTHRIPPVKEPPQQPDKRHQWPPGVQMPPDDDLRSDGSDEPDGFRCYPQRGDSLAYTARRAGPRLFNAVQMAAAAFIAAASLLIYGVKAHLGTTGINGVLAAYISLAVGGGLVALMMLKLKPPKEPAPPEPGAWRPRARHRSVAAIFTVLISLGLGAWLMDWPSHEALLVSTRFWAMMGVALAVPFLLVAAILLAHDLRGSVPRALPQVLIVAAFAAAVPLFVDFPSTAKLPSWFVTALITMAALGLGTWILGAARARWLDERGSWVEGVTGSRPYWLFERLLAAAAPLTLAVALFTALDAKWVAWFTLALVGAGAWPYILARPQLADTGDPDPLCSKGPAWVRHVGAVANFLAVVAWVTVGAFLLSAIRDGRFAAAAIGAASVLVIGAVFAILVLLTWGTRKNRFGLAVAVALALLFSRPLGSLVLAGHWFLLAFSVLLLVVAFLNVMALRHGKLNANAAHTEISRRLRAGDEGGGDGDPTGGLRPGALSSREEALFNLLYPFRWGSGRQGAERTGVVPQTLSRLMAELSDSDEPPFFKHFLRVDLREVEARDEDPDRELLIRCFGVTGFASEETDPPLEDEIRIPFHSAGRFAERVQAQADAVPAQP